MTLISHVSLVSILTRILGSLSESSLTRETLRSSFKTMLQNHPYPQHRAFKLSGITSWIQILRQTYFCIQLRSPDIHGHPNSLWNEMPGLPVLCAQRPGHKVSQTTVTPFLDNTGLCCRNCLVYPDYCIKISDCGSAKPSYSSDYYRLEEGEDLLPVRWMAWEAVLLVRLSRCSTRLICHFSGCLYH